MGTKKGQVRKTARRAYEPNKKSDYEKARAFISFRQSMFYGDKSRISRVRQGPLFKGKWTDFVFTMKKK